MLMKKVLREHRSEEVTLGQRLGIRQQSQLIIIIIIIIIIKVLSWCLYTDELIYSSEQPCEVSTIIMPLYWWGN